MQNLNKRSRPSNNRNVITQQPRVCIRHSDRNDSRQDLISANSALLNLDWTSKSARTKTLLFPPTTARGSENKGRSFFSPPVLGAYSIFPKRAQNSGRGGREETPQQPMADLEGAEVGHLPSGPPGFISASGRSRDRASPPLSSLPSQHAHAKYTRRCVADSRKTMAPERTWGQTV